MKEWLGIIALEGERTLDGRLILPGALTWDGTRPLLLSAPVEFGTRTVGFIDNIHRKGSELVAIGRIHEGELEPGIAYPIGADIELVKKVGDGDAMHVRRGVLRGATLCDRSAWAGCGIMLR